MCLVGLAFGGENLLITSIGPISCILANWIECCFQRLLTYPQIIPNSPAPFVPRYLMKVLKCLNIYILVMAHRTFLPWYFCQWWGSWEPYRQPPLALWFPPVLSVQIFSKKRLHILNLWRYRGTNTQKIPMCLFCQETFMSIENFVKHIVNHH